MRQVFRDVIRFLEGYISTKRVLDEGSVRGHGYSAGANDHAFTGSRNVMFVGVGKPTPFKGLNDTGQVGGIFGSPVTPGVATLQPIITTLTVDSNPTGVTITVSPLDINGNGNGTT